PLHSYPTRRSSDLKMYWEILSSYFLKNHLPNSGKIRVTTRPKTITDTPNLIQKALLISPVDIPDITANTNKAKVSVIIVPPTVILTALFLAMPNLLTMG